MVLEYIRYTIPTHRAADFIAAYHRAGGVLDADPHCEGYEIAQGVEEPEHFVVRIQWDSMSGHEKGFRGSAGFADFFAAVKPFVEQIDEMKHYTRLAP